LRSLYVAAALAGLAGLTALVLILWRLAGLL